MSKNPLDPNPDMEIQNEPIEMIMNDIGHIIAKALPKEYGFNLLIFNFGKGGATFYISNAQRADMLEAMKEFISKQESKA